MLCTNRREDCVRRKRRDPPMKDRRNFFRTRLFTHSQRTPWIQKSEDSHVWEVRSRRHNEKNYGFATNELKSDGVSMKLKYMARAVFLAETAWPFGKEQSRKKEKRSERASERRTTRIRRSSRKTMRNKRKRKKMEKKKEKQFEKRNAARSFGHKVLSLADLSRFSIIPSLSTDVTLFSLRNSKWTSNTI